MFRDLVFLGAVWFPNMTRATACPCGRKRAWQLSPRPCPTLARGPHTSTSSTNSAGIRALCTPSRNAPEPFGHVGTGENGFQSLPTCLVALRELQRCSCPLDCPPLPTTATARRYPTPCVRCDIAMKNTNTAQTAIRRTRSYTPCA